MILVGSKNSWSEQHIYQMEWLEKLKIFGWME